MLSTTHSPIEQYVINSVKEKRLQKGISQKELAYMLDVSIGFIGDVENPNYRAKYNLNHLNELAKIFNCSPKDFLPERALEKQYIKEQKTKRETSKDKEREKE